MIVQPSLDIDPLKLGADWFDQMFAATGQDFEVSSVDAASIGTGQIGENVRFRLTYSDETVEAPDSLVGKFPSYNEKSRMTAQLLGHYRREVNFYKTFDVAKQIAPAFIYGDHDPETNRFCLIMEDMSPAAQGDQLGGGTLRQAELAIDSAAILHVAHWNDESLDALDWLDGTEAAPDSPFTQSMMSGFWTGFKERYGDRVSPDDVAVGDAYAAFMTRVGNEDFYDGPFALTHGDYRLDNMLFGDESAPKPLAVVDWQTPGKRGPAIDVAYYIGAGFKRADRPAYENQLLERYHDQITRAGIDYPFAQFKEHYAWYAFYGMAVAFGAAMLVGQTDRGDEMFLTMLRRHAGQARDNGGLDLIN